MPDESLDININLDSNNVASGKYNGNVEFLDYKNNKKIGELPLEIISSTPKGSCCECENQSN